MGMTLRDLIANLETASKSHPEQLDKPIKFRRFVGSVAEETVPVGGLYVVDGQLCLTDNTFLSHFPHRGPR